MSLGFVDASCYRLSSRVALLNCQQSFTAQPSFGFGDYSLQLLAVLPRSSHTRYAGQAAIPGRPGGCARWPSASA